jgi:hypothetical protein
MFENLSRIEGYFKIVILVEIFASSNPVINLNNKVLKKIIPSYQDTIQLTEEIIFKKLPILPDIDIAESFLISGDTCALIDIHVSNINLHKRDITLQFSSE